MSRKLSLKVLRNAFTTLYRRNSVLAITGLILLVVGLLLLLYMPFETRQVMGINLWIKPIKFYLSSKINCLFKYLAGEWCFRRKANKDYCANFTMEGYSSHGVTSSF